MVAAVGDSNVWLAGHSLGSAMAMLAGKSMAKTGTFLSFIGDKLPDTGNDASDAALSMAALILNETVNAKEESGLGDFFFEAVQDLLGLAEAPAYYYNKFGADAIINKLDQLYADTGFASFKPCDKDLFDKYFNA